VLSGPAVERIRDSSLREVVVTDSIPLPPSKRIPKITTLSVAPLIGEAIKRIHRGESVGALFSSEVSFTQEMLLWEDGVARKLDMRGEPDGLGSPNGGHDPSDGASTEDTASPAELASAHGGDR
jgi:hypothetical protein